MPEGVVTIASDPLTAYRALRREGALRPDPCQELAIEKMQGLHHAVLNYQPQTGAKGWRERLGLSRRPRLQAPQGLYIYGGVGRGKTMLMDLFYQNTPVEKKRRVHFHEFMLEVHDRLHHWRQAFAERNGRKRGSMEDDPIQPLARRLADEAWLLCFDEFHVVDIADAMILGRLFTALFELGVVVVATSNWPPDDLYKDGLQRHLFLPFIDLLKQKLDILEIADGTDYRLARLHGMKIYHYPLGPAAAKALAQLFNDLTDGAEGREDELVLKGRSVIVPRAARGVAWFPFEELCARPLGAADYLALATHFHTVIIDGVPRFTEDRRNEAKRFITLIDALYEHKTYAVIAAEAAPEKLYAAETHAFEFERTVSRLMEMQSADYLQRHHLT
jgi:cell division protein ZapE